MTVAPQAAPLVVGPEALAPGAKAVANKRSLEAAREFEAVFISQMISLMFSGLGSSGMFSGGHGEETYRAMLYQEFGEAVTKAGGIGISDAVTREILKHQEVDTP